MNRRMFGQMVGGAAMAQALFQGKAQGPRAGTSAAGAGRFSVMLWTMEKQAPLERCIEMVAEAGYQGVELVGEFQKWSDADTRRVMAKMKSLGLVFDAMSGVKAGFANTGETDAFFTQFAEQIRWANKLECPQIILLSGKKVEGAADGEQHRTAIANLQRASEMAGKNGIEIVIEPIDPLENPTIYLTTVTEGFEIVRSVNKKNVKVLYDFYHEQRAFGNLIEKLEKNVEWVGLVHVADVPGRHEPGTGEIDYASIFRKLAELKYGGFVAMEYYATGDPVASLKRQRLAALRAMGAEG